MHHPHTPLLRSRVLTWAALLLAGGLLVGCGQSDAAGDRAADADQASGQTSSQTSDAFPTTVASGQVGDLTEVTIESRPESIVSLSPTATEMLWAVGAGDQVVAVDDQSDYPEDVPSTELSGYEPNIEAILAHAPDLVVSAGDSGDLVAGLEDAGVPTLLLPSATDLEEAYDQIERVGAATGHVAEAAQVVAETQEGIEAAVGSAPDVAGLTYFHELSPDLYTTTGDTFIGEVYGLFGLESIADPAAKGGDLYPQLSAEYVVSADPDFVFLADSECCDVHADDLGERAGWQGLDAVEHDRIVELDEDVTSRWGPRVVEFAETVARVVSEHENAG